VDTPCHTGLVIRLTVASNVSASGGRADNENKSASPISVESGGGTKRDVDVLSQMEEEEEEEEERQEANDKR
jgi:hypothetical protein